MLTVRVATTDELRACLEVRYRVFVIGQDVPLDEEVDGLDPECTHFVARVGDQVVGTARLLVSAGVAKAQRVAVLAAWRGHGVGRALMDALEAAAAESGHAELVLSSQVEVITFYERPGHRAEGPVYLDAGIEHRTMRRRLR